MSCEVAFGTIDLINIAFGVFNEYGAGVLQKRYNEAMRSRELQIKYYKEFPARAAPLIDQLVKTYKKEHKLTYPVDLYKDALKDPMILDKYIHLPLKEKSLDDYLKFAMTQPKTTKKSLADYFDHLPYLQ